MRKVVFWVSIAVMAAALCLGFGYLAEQSEQAAVYEELREEVVAEPGPEETPEEAPEQVSPAEETVQPEEPEKPPYTSPIDFEALWEMNPDVYAWIEIPGTDVAYPILQSETDDTYYLNHTVAGVSGLPGSIYTESANGKDFSDFNTVIYGHNMKNGSMFGGLKKYRDGTYLEEHREIVIYTPEAEYHYRVFAAVVYSDRHLLRAFDNNDPESCQDYLDSLRETRDLNSQVLEDVEVTAESKLITLSTCIGSRPNNRYLIVAVLEDDAA